MSEPARVVDPDLGAWVNAEFGVTLRTVSSPVGLDCADLVGLALRRNPRRAHLLVSTVLGKHIPVDPWLVTAAGRLLGELVAEALQPAVPRDRLRDWSAAASAALRDNAPAELIADLDHVLSTRAVAPVVVLGFAETATSLGHLVADQLPAAYYLHSTRRSVPEVAVAGSFEEGHSHATNHLLLPVPVTLFDDDHPLVLVDDELSTGNTAMGTIRQAHRRHPRARYVVASLIDLRTDEDARQMDLLATRLGCQIDTVSLVRGAVDLPGELTSTVFRRLKELPNPPPSFRAARSEAVGGTWIQWPADVPDGGRHGFTASDKPRFEEALSAAGAELMQLVRARVGVTGPCGPEYRVSVVGTEELMYLPLRLALHLSADAALRVTFQSTTRSPVLALDEPGYPIRRQFSFADPEGDSEVPRFLYNVDGAPAGTRGVVDAASLEPSTRPDLVVLITDAAADTDILRGPLGPVAALCDAGLRTELAVLGAVDPAGLARRRSATPVAGLPSPLTGPTFGSYAPQEVQWLLTDLSELDLEGDVAEREAAIQSGRAHYAESLPVEFQPDARYQELFAAVLSESAERLALAVGRVTELVLLERGPDIVLASLARAGTPVGILMRRWARLRRGLTIPHYALSIVRGRGIDSVALQYVASQHDSRSVVFVDGWTGKGAIALELAAALDRIRLESGLEFSADLAVLADPGYCVRTFGTRDDFLIASACLNSTVSGLVSRTVLNEKYLRTNQFHGAKFYRQLADVDVSNVLLDSVTAAFPAVADEVLAGLAALASSDREPTFAGLKAIEAIRDEYGIESVNFVKPGVGETTRVLLRRVPWRILVREADNPDHEHLRLLAQQRNVPVEVRPDLPYTCVGLIRRMSAAEPGEG